MGQRFGGAFIQKFSLRYACYLRFSLRTTRASVKQMKLSKFVHSIWERMRNDFYWVALKHAGEVFCPNIGLNHVDTYPRAAFPSVFP
jgi:hypothetical protein